MIPFFDIQNAEVICSADGPGTFVFAFERMIAKMRSKWILHEEG